jgi:hypothetical protein
MIKVNRESSDSSPQDRLAGGSRRTYRPPQIRHLGDYRDLTMGSSPGVTDSGAMGRPVGGPNPYGSIEDEIDLQIP